MSLKPTDSDTQLFSESGSPNCRPGEIPSPPPHSPEVDLSWILTSCGAGQSPQIVHAHLITLSPSALLLISPRQLDVDEIFLKRISPRFDRKFLRCRLWPAPTALDDDPIANGESHRFHYGLQFVGFTEWSLLTNWLVEGLLDKGGIPKPRPSTLTSSFGYRTKAENSLMPLLSAIGLVVVYATNLNW